MDCSLYVNRPCKTFADEQLSAQRLANALYGSCGAGCASFKFEGNTVGLLNQIVGAVVAEEALDKIDPDAGFFKKSMAVIAGFEGEKVIEEKIDEHVVKPEGE